MLKTLRNEFKLKYFTFVECPRSNFDVLQWTANRQFVFAYRLFVTLYCITWFVYDVVTTNDPYYYAYLTHWGELEMTLYFGIAFVVFLMESRCLDKTNNPKSRLSIYHVTTTEAENVEDRDLLWYHKITYAMLNIYLTLAAVITLVYWIGNLQGLVQPSKTLDTINIHVHVVNSILAFIELVMTSTTIRILHFIQPMLFGLVYIMFNLILHWSGVNSNVYDAVDWNLTPDLAAAYGFGLSFGLTTAVHCILVYGIYRIRAFIASLVFSNSDNKIELNRYEPKPTSV